MCFSFFKKLFFISNQFLIIILIPLWNVHSMSIICSWSGNFPCINVIVLFMYLWTGPTPMRGKIAWIVCQSTWRCPAWERCGVQVRGHELAVWPLLGRRVAAVRTRAGLSNLWARKFKGEYFRFVCFGPKVDYIDPKWDISGTGKAAAPL